MVNFAQFKVYKSRTRTRARAPSILSLSAFRLPIQRSNAIIVVGFNNLCIQLSIQKFKYPFLNPKLYIGTLFSTFFSAFLNNETERATPEDKEKSKTKINISSFLK